MSRVKRSQYMIDEAVKSYQGGAGLRSICDVTGASPKTVRKWLQAAGVEMRRSGRPEGYVVDRDEMQRLINEKASVAYVAQGLGVPVGVVWRRGAKWGLIQKPEDVEAERKRVEIERQLSTVRVVSEEEYNGE